MDKPEAVRRRLPDERKSITHRFVIDGQHKCYIIVGLYEDGTPGELFVNISKEGSTFSGLVDALAIQVSMSLQHGVPLRQIVDKHMGSSYEPSGFTSNPDIPRASSLTDYIARWLKLKFLKDED